MERLKKTRASLTGSSFMLGGIGSPKSYAIPSAQPPFTFSAGWCGDTMKKRVLYPPKYHTVHCSGCWPYSTKSCSVTSRMLPPAPVEVDHPHVVRDATGQLVQHEHVALASAHQQIPGGLVVVEGDLLPGVG